MILGVLAGGATGCTLLIPFDEVEVSTDAGTDGAADPTDARPAMDGTVPPGDGGPNDATAATNYDACVGHVDGYYCGGDQIPWPVRDDRVTCASNKVAAVAHCTTGQGCLGMLDGYPDECDECSTKPDGTYCGRDFSGWQPKNANQRVRCQGGREVGLLLCTTCKSSGGASTCL